MKYYQAKAGKIKGTNFKEMVQKAKKFFTNIQSKSKRKPYLRSKYFNKSKVFLDYFWEHLFGKQNLRDRQRRVQFYEAALELIENTNFAPQSKENPNMRREIMHRFYGVTKEKNPFIVQIKEDKRTNQKYFISVFPED